MTSSPCNRGMTRSSSNTSGRSFSTSATVAIPSPVSPTSLRDLSSCKSLLSPSRTKPWSSATTMVVIYPPPIFFRKQRQSHRNTCATVGHRFNAKFSTDQQHALAHPSQAQAASQRRRDRIESFAGIAQCDRQPRLFDTNGQRHVWDAGVTRYVRERLLHHAKRDELYLRRNLTLHKCLPREPNADAGAQMEFFYMRLQCHEQAKIVEHIGAQIARRLPHVSQQLHDNFPRVAN